MRLGFLALLVSGCGPYEELWGDEGRVRYYTTLDGNDGQWAPARPVATGTSFEVRGDAWRDSSGYVHDYGPNGTLESSDPTVLLVAEPDGDSAGLRALAPGVATLSWSGGDAADSVDVEVADPVAFTLDDPAFAEFPFFEAERGATLVHGTFPPELGTHVRAFGDQPLDLWFYLLDEHGRRLGHVGTGVELSSSEVSVAYRDHLRVGADAAAGAYPLSYGDFPIGELHLERASTADVARIELVVVAAELTEFTSFDVALLAIAYDAAGARILQPPVDWSFPEQFAVAPLDTYLTNFDYAPRRDVLALDWMGEPATTEFTFGATVAGASTEVTVPLTLGSATTAEPEEPDTNNDDSTVNRDAYGRWLSSNTCCGGSAGAFLVCAVRALRRKRDRPRAAAPVPDVQPGHNPSPQRTVSDSSSHA